MRPLLAAKLTDVPSLSFPYLASPKLDGIRALVDSGKVYSRTWKPIRQPEVQRLFSHLHGFDGELIYGSPTDKLCYNKTNSHVMTSYSLPSKDLTLYTFDQWNIDGPFHRRLELLYEAPQVRVVFHKLIRNLEELLAFEEECLLEGYEGIMLRDPEGKYKEGRSTGKEGILIKVKRFEDGEAVIIDFLELETNLNTPVIDNLGYQKRSSRMEGKVAAGTLGTLVVRDLVTGIEFGIGSGFSDECRQRIWENQSHYIDRIVKYKHFPYGALDKPRQPIFLGFRDPIDL